MFPKKFRPHRFDGVRTAEDLVIRAEAVGMQGPGTELALHWWVNLGPEFDSTIFVFPDEDHHRLFGVAATGPKRYHTLRKDGERWRVGWTHEPAPEGTTFALLAWEVQETTAGT